MEAYFDNANAIDVHNHLRQGGLELERHWKTQTWWHRNFATIFGMCESDAYLAFLYFHPLAPILSHREFTERLFLQLLTYKSSFHDTGPSARLRKHMPVAPTEQPLQTVVAKIMSSHTLKTNMRECPVFQYKRQRLEQDEEGTSHNMAVYLVCNGSVASAVKERQHIIATSARSYMRRSFLFVTLEVQSLDLHRAWLFTLTKLRSRFEPESNLIT